MRKNCSCDRNILLKFEAEGREFATFLRSLEHLFEQEKGRKVFKTECVLTCFWRFLRSGTLKQLRLKSEKIIGI